MMDTCQFNQETPINLYNTPAPPKMLQQKQYQYITGTGRHHYLTKYSSPNTIYKSTNKYANLIQQPYIKGHTTHYAFLISLNILNYPSYLDQTLVNITKQSVSLVMSLSPTNMITNTQLHQKYIHPLSFFGSLTIIKGYS